MAAKVDAFLQKTGRGNGKLLGFCGHATRGRRRIFRDRSWADPPGGGAGPIGQPVRAALGGEAIEILLDETRTDEQRIEGFRDLMAERFDLPLISRYVLGSHWRRATPEQRDEYSTLFEKFLVSTYASRLGEYGGEILEVKSARQEGKKDTIVSTRIGKKGGPLVRVDWRVRKMDHGYKVVDVIIEGVSMVITQRDEFASVIRRAGGNVEGLLAKLRDKSG